jgi:hypothetical protein
LPNVPEKARAKLLEPEKRWCRDSDEGVFSLVFYSDFDAPGGAW